MEASDRGDNKHHSMKVFLKAWVFRNNGIILMATCILGFSHVINSSPNLDSP